MKRVLPPVVAFGRNAGLSQTLSKRVPRVARLPLRLRVVTGAPLEGTIPDAVVEAEAVAKVQPVPRTGIVIGGAMVR